MSQEASPSVDADVIELGDVAVSLAPPNEDPSEPGETIWYFKVPFHEAMRPGATIEIPPAEGLVAETFTLPLPEDIAEAIYFFASEASAKSTGNIINVDAGNVQAFTR